MAPQAAEGGLQGPAGRVRLPGLPGPGRCAMWTRSEPGCWAQTVVRSHSHRPPSTQPRASSLALSCLSLLIYKLWVLLIIRPASGCRRDHPSPYVCFARHDDPGLWRVPPPWRWFLEAHGSQAPPLYMRDSGIHGFQLSARAPAANCRGCQPTQAALLSGQQGRQGDQSGCSGPQRGEPGPPPGRRCDFKHGTPCM